MTEQNDHPASDNAPSDNAPIEACLETWLETATQKLSEDSIAQVREEIDAHYSSALEDALTSGAPAAEAHRAALQSLGDATSVNRAYRKVLITASEAKLLRKIERSTPHLSWIKKALLLVILAYCIPTFLYAGLRGMLVFTLVVSFTTRSYIFLRTPTSAAGRRLRFAKWAGWAVLPFVFIGHPAMTGLLVISLAIVFFLILDELRRVKLRNKLPLERWPLGLYT